MSEEHREEVVKNGDKNAIYITIHNRVYDVSNFLEEHPGGGDVLLEYAGKDATEAFEDVGHSDDAHEMLKQYLIGELEDSEKSSNVKNQTNGTDGGVAWCEWVILPIGVVLVATLIYRAYLFYNTR
ncbi:cytochrome B5-like protein [Dinothrombium tinctorium]|uniref:Cytochrome B5-like protein n=1 Tax=Dinothrombium tinctorium TaxID=1965070 RepID=A0A3S3P7V0_9ACAR|nr:cytochrome B5-like protein [Dinothrombium tinctorium]RWS02971.1 cytochrome B5-like protein [Dinothrombium tinctorium]RWS02974.1 cytochrome B5-like protein [Dinothrombium tinctorium]